MHIFCSKDTELDYETVDHIRDLYALCFFGTDELAPEQKKHLDTCISKMNTFDWYLGYENSQLISIVSLVHNYQNAYLYDLDIDQEENICSLAVHPEYRGRGYAREMMKFLINHHKSSKETDVNGRPLKGNRFSHRLIRIARVDPLVLEIKLDSPHREQLIKLYESLGFKQQTVTQTGEFYRLQF